MKATALALLGMSLLAFSSAWAADTSASPGTGGGGHGGGMHVRKNEHSCAEILKACQNAGFTPGRKPRPGSRGNIKDCLNQVLAGTMISGLVVPTSDKVAACKAKQAAKLKRRERRKHRGNYKPKPGVSDAPVTNPSPVTSPAK